MNKYFPIVFGAIAAAFGSYAQQHGFPAMSIDLIHWTLSGKYTIYAATLISLASVVYLMWLSAQDQAGKISVPVYILHASFQGTAVAYVGMRLFQGDEGAVWFIPAVLTMVYSWLIPSMNLRPLRILMNFILTCSLMVVGFHMSAIIGAENIVGAFKGVVTAESLMVSLIIIMMLVAIEGYILPKKKAKPEMAAAEG